MKKKALLIGNANFLDPKIKPLTAPHDDIKDLRNLLVDKSIGGFEPFDPIFDVGVTAAKTAISKLFRNALPDDLIVFYYAGHGIRDDDGRLYLAVPETNSASIDATALEASYILNKLKKSPSRKKIVILDCCHAGAVTGDDGLFLSRDVVDNAAIKDNFVPDGEGVYVLAACRAGESAFESKDGGSVYTRTLINGIETGNAAPDKDILTIDDIHEFIRQRRLYDDDLDRSNPHTEPLKISSVGDEVEFCRNPNVRRPISEDLIKALEHEDVELRRGAVDALSDMIENASEFERNNARSLLSKRLKSEFHKKVRGEIQQALGIAVSKPDRINVINPTSFENDEESNQALILRFLKNWPDWAFSILKIIEWGGEQENFEKLGTLSATEISNELMILLDDGFVKETEGHSGNKLYQYKSKNAPAPVVFMDDETLGAKINAFVRIYSNRIAAVILTLLLLSFAWGTFSESVGGNGENKPAKLIYQIDPLVPEHAKISGRCVIKFDISLSGQPQNVEALKCSDALFEKPAIRSVQQWKYEPEVKNGNPVKTIGMEAEIDFDVLNSRPDEDEKVDDLRAESKTVNSPHYCQVDVNYAPVQRTYSKTVEVQEATRSFQIIAPQFEAVTETVIVQEGGYKYIDPVYETVIETVIVQPATYEFELIPAKFETTQRRAIFGVYDDNRLTANYDYRKVASPATIERIEIPEVTKQISLRKVSKWSSREPTYSPPITQQITRRVVKKPGSYKEVTEAAKFETVSKTFTLKKGSVQSEPSVCNISFSKSLVSDMKKALRERGHYTGAIDGDWTQELFNAVAAFMAPNTIDSKPQIPVRVLKKLGLDPNNYSIN